MSGKLSTKDFDFTGEMGSEGTTIEELGRNYFKVILGHAPNHPGSANQLQFGIKQNAKGNNLILKVCFYGTTDRPFNTYFVSWSHDKENWIPIHWEKGWYPGINGDITDTLFFPEFKEDTVWAGTQVPISYEMVDDMVRKWTDNPGVDFHTIGQSLGGRNIYRLIIKPLKASTQKPLRHYFASQHCEHNAIWRMVGMIEWLLSNEGIEFRKKNICHFVLMMNPDSPSNGWFIMNSEGRDMQRWRPDGDNGGPDKKAGYGAQPHESWEAQQDFEALMTKEPFDTVWSMHTWRGVVENMIIPGEWMEKRTSGTWRDFRSYMLKYDIKGLCKPLKVLEVHPKTYKSWGHGPYQKYGITSFGCEGGGNIYTKKDNLESGQVLVRSLAEFCRRFS